jgi:hypothetical protein
MSSVANKDVISSPESCRWGVSIVFPRALETFLTKQSERSVGARNDSSRSGKEEEKRCSLFHSRPRPLPHAVAQRQPRPKVMVPTTATALLMANRRVLAGPRIHRRHVAACHSESSQQQSGSDTSKEDSGMEIEPRKMPTRFWRRRATSLIGKRRRPVARRKGGVAGAGTSSAMLTLGVFWILTILWVRTTVSSHSRLLVHAGKASSKRRMPPRQKPARPPPVVAPRRRPPTRRRRMRRWPTRRYHHPPTPAPSSSSMPSFRPSVSQAPTRPDYDARCPGLLYDCVSPTPLQRCDDSSNSSTNSSSSSNNDSNIRRSTEARDVFCFCTVDVEGRPFCANERLCSESAPCESSMGCPGHQRCIPRTCCPPPIPPVGDSGRGVGTCGCPCGMCGIGTSVAPGGGLHSTTPHSAQLAEKQQPLLMMPPPPSSNINRSCVPTMFGECA